MSQIVHAHAQKRRDLDLERSFTSLNWFDRSQKGRISMDVQGSINSLLNKYLMNCVMIY